MTQSPQPSLEAAVKEAVEKRFDCREGIAFERFTEGFRAGWSAREAAKSLAAPQDTARLAKDAAEQIAKTIQAYVSGGDANFWAGLIERQLHRAIAAAMGVSPQPPAKKEEK